MSDEPGQVFQVEGRWHCSIHGQLHTLYGNVVTEEGVVTCSACATPPGRSMPMVPQGGGRLFAAPVDADPNDPASWNEVSGATVTGIGFGSAVESEEGDPVMFADLPGYVPVEAGFDFFLPAAEDDPPAGWTPHDPAEPVSFETTGETDAEGLRALFGDDPAKAPHSLTYTHTYTESGRPRRPVVPRWRLLRRWLTGITHRRAVRRWVKAGRPDVTHEVLVYVPHARVEATKADHGMMTASFTVVPVPEATSPWYDLPEPVEEP